MCGINKKWRIRGLALRPVPQERKTYYFYIFSGTSLQVNTKSEHELIQNTQKKLQVAFDRLKPDTCLVLENHHPGCRFILLYFLSNKAIKNVMYIASEQAGVYHSAMPSFRNKTLFDLCTAALFRGTSKVFMGFLASFCAIVLGLESIALTSLALSRNSSRPCSMHCIKKLKSPA
jgi:hypothetical protein